MKFFLKKFCDPQNDPFLMRFKGGFCVNFPGFARTLPQHARDQFSTVLNFFTFLTLPRGPPCAWIKNLKKSSKSTPTEAKNTRFRAKTGPNKNEIFEKTRFAGPQKGHETRWRKVGSHKKGRRGPKVPKTARETSQEPF